MAKVIQTVRLPDGTLQDVRVPEEWTPDQIRDNLRASDFFQQNFPEAGAADAPPAAQDTPGALRRFGFGLLQQSGLIEEAANLLEQKLTPKREEQVVPPRRVDIASEIPVPADAEPLEPGSLGFREDPGFTIPAVTEESIRAEQDERKASALRATFPDIAGTEFEDTTAAEVGRVSRLMTDLLTFPLPAAQQARLANQVRGGTRILSTSAGRQQLARAATEAGVGVGLFGAADATIRNLADEGKINPDQVATAMLVAGAGGATIGPLLAAGGGRLGRWLDERVAQGDRLKPIQVRKDVQEATGQQLSREEAGDLISAIEKVSANTKVERSQLDSLLGVNPPEKKARDARRKQVRAAFKDDPEMADLLARDADEIVAQNAANTARIEGAIPEARNLIRRQGLTQSEAIRRRERASQEAATIREELGSTQARPEAAEALRTRERAREAAGLQRGETVPRTREGNIRGFWKLGNDVISRIENIAPEVAIGVRRVTQRTAANSADAIERMDRFYQSPEYKALKRRDRRDLDRALLNGQLDVAHGIMAKSPGLNELYNENIFKMLRETQEARRAGGAEGFLPSFHPRLVKSVPKLRRRMGRQARTRVDNQIAAAENAKGRPLDEFELAGIYNQVLGGRPLRTDRTRRVNEIEDKDLDLYEGSRDSLVSYMHRQAENQATRDFFRENLGRDVPLGTSVDQTTLGNILANARMRGDVPDSEIAELAELLATHFGVARQGPSLGRRRFKDVFTGLTLGFNPSSTVTQIGDIAPTLARMGVRDTLAALLGPKRINVYDVGVREAAKELRTARGAAKFVRSGLKAMGFDQLDKLAGNTAVNASLRKWFRKARENPNALVEELQPLYGEGTPRLLGDLADRRISDDVKTLLLWDVGKIRPVAREDMPLHFQQNPNGRVYYSLLSWTLKQLNFIRNNALADVGRGKVLKGSKGLISLALLMGMANMPANVIKDVIAGRDVEPDESFVEGMLSLGMSGKFVVDALNRGQGERAVTSAVPVLGIAGDAIGGIWQAIAQGDPVKFVRATPTGRALHNILGNGTSGDLASSIGSVVIPEAGAAVNEVPDGRVDPSIAVQPPVIRDVPRDVIKEFENPNQVGRDPATGLWVPHPSIEGGTPTLGYGHKLTSAEDRSGKVRIGNEMVSYRDGLTDAQVEQLLAQDTAKAREDVENLVRVPLGPNEKEALVSLVYNVGGPAFSRSKALKALNRGDRRTFAEEAFDPQRGFVKVGGRISRGLQNRRASERLLFQTPDAWLAQARADLRRAVLRENESRARIPAIAERLLASETGGFGPEDRRVGDIPLDDPTLLSMELF